MGNVAPYAPHHVQEWGTLPREVGSPCQRMTGLGRSATPEWQPSRSAPIRHLQQHCDEWRVHVNRFVDKLFGQHVIRRVCHDRPFTSQAPMWKCEEVDAAYAETAMHQVARNTRNAMLRQNANDRAITTRWFPHSTHDWRITSRQCFGRRGFRGIEVISAALAWDRFAELLHPTPPKSSLRR